MRSYGQYCAIARSLDVVGDRWTLLIIRELALRGPCRYTDIRAGLPGIASNLLADRLRELERAGVVAREEAPPPVATTLFSLTPRGEQLTPVLDDLTRWGLPLMTEPKQEDVVQSRWLASALEMMLTDHEPEAPPVSLELRMGDEPLVIEARAGEVHTRLGGDETADARLSGGSTPIMGLLVGFLDLAGAQAKGVELEGDAAVIDRVRSPEPPVGAAGSG